MKAICNGHSVNQQMEQTQRTYGCSEKKKKRLAVLSERVYTFHVVDVTMSTA